MYIFQLLKHTLHVWRRMWSYLACLSHLWVLPWLPLCCVHNKSGFYGTFCFGELLWLRFTSRHCTTVSVLRGRRFYIQIQIMGLCDKPMKIPTVLRVTAVQMQIKQLYYSRVNLRADSQFSTLQMCYNEILWSFPSPIIPCVKSRGSFYSNSAQIRLDYEKGGNTTCKWLKNNHTAAFFFCLWSELAKHNTH